MIVDECDALCEMLLAKNTRYGNSAIDPLRIMSRCDATEQIRVRIDDKLSRLARGSELHDGEDTVGDLIGYLILLRIAEKTAPVPVTTVAKGDAGSPLVPVEP